MAMAYQTPWQDDTISALDTNVQDIAIGGKLVRVQQNISDVEFTRAKSDVELRQWIKETLAKELATAMLELNLLEFTSYQDPTTMQTKIAVRCYLAPNDQVKLLRIHAQ